MTRQSGASIPIIPTMPNVPLLESMIQVFYETTTGLRISSVDGTAFIDNCPNIVAYADGEHYIEIYDATGRPIKGYLKSAGDGEDLGSEIVNAFGNHPSYAFETFTAGAGNLITQAVNTTGYGIAYKDSAEYVVGRLLKCVNAVTVNSGANPAIYLSTDHIVQTIVFTFNGTSYKTVSASSLHGDIGLNAATDFALTGFSLKQVTGPSTDGCTITSTKNGTAMDAFSYKNSSFTYNSSSYFVVVKRVL